LKKIAIASDHAGFLLKEYLQKCSYEGAIEWIDLGAHDEQPSDYPDFAKAMAITIKNKICERGILICGSGVGASVAANKFSGIRASVCHDTYSAHQGVEHDDMNILVLGARVVGFYLAHELVHSFLKASFSEDPRHMARLLKIRSFEELL